MGCTIAMHTRSLAECQQNCRVADNKCTWIIAGIVMRNCMSCPSGCDASDGVHECLFGCEHGFSMAPPTTPPTPPAPPSPEPSAPPSPPLSATCEEECLKHGHCCTGTISSYSHPSCAMG